MPYHNIMAKTIPEENEDDGDLVTIISSDEVLRQQLTSGDIPDASERLPLLLEAGGRRGGGSATDCSCFSFVIQGLVVLEIVSLLFYVTLLLYSTRLKNIDRNRDAIVLFIYVLVVYIPS
jgi:hypothetical protein